MPLFNPLENIGEIRDFGGATIPPRWLLCFGQAVSRTTYAALFAYLGTVHGVGDGATTFNLPDCRGRVRASKDNMGGVSANRLTDPLNGDTLGATGGSEKLLPQEDGVTGPGFVEGIIQAADGGTPIVQPTIIVNTAIYAGV